MHTYYNPHYAYNSGYCKSATFDIGKYLYELQHKPGVRQELFKNFQKMRNRASEGVHRQVATINAESNLFGTWPPLTPMLETAKTMAGPMADHLEGMFTPHNIEMAQRLMGLL